jgi:hypothetical protein
MPTVLVYPSTMSTDIHKFELVAGDVAYRGSGEVTGHLGWDNDRKSYRMSEHNGDLRVLTYTGSIGWFALEDAASKAASPATLTVLRERASDQSLQALGTLPNTSRPAALGKPGEQVYGVRFVGDRGYLVTFRRADPLYVLDLSNPADPKALGELTVAGFSDQLVPLAHDLLLGVGRDADDQGVVGGIKLALFDVADPAKPSQRASFVMGGTYSSSAADYSRHGLNLFMRGNVARIALPVNLAPPGPTFAPGGWQSGLARFEVDTAARTMREKPMVGASSGDGPRSPLAGTQPADRGPGLLPGCRGTERPHLVSQASTRGVQQHAVLRCRGGHEPPRSAARASSIASSCDGLKMDDKAGFVLRIETVINHPEEFRARRQVLRDGKRRIEWVALRKGRGASVLPPRDLAAGQRLFLRCPGSMVVYGGPGVQPIGATRRLLVLNFLAGNQAVAARESMRARRGPGAGFRWPASRVKAKACSALVGRR